MMSLTETIRFGRYAVVIARSGVASSAAGIHLARIGRGLFQFSFYLKSWTNPLSCLYTPSSSVVAEDLFETGALIGHSHDGLRGTSRRRSKRLERSGA